jgi:hypothetical protein
LGLPFDFSVSRQDMDVILDQLAATLQRVPIWYLWRPLLRDVKDDMVLEAAANGAATHLVTFNIRDFGEAPLRFGIERAGPLKGDLQTIIVRLKSAGENIASVIGHLERVAPEQLNVIREYLQTVVPMVHGVERKRVGPMETLELRQDMAGSKHPWRFLAQNMSDGTLRALGVLVALFQGNRDYAPTLVGIEGPETALHPAASAALREALTRASGNAQMIVTSHGPDLLDDRAIGVDAFLALVSEGGETRIAPIDEASRKVMRQQLFFAGELLRLNQLAPDPAELAAQERRQGELLGEAAP